MPLISVIVPVYKVEKYLSKCIESVINQDFKDIEVIIVDDGSPDSCPKICDEYAQRDSRVKVIHKENGGLSDARNVGIKAAAGDYLMFLDSDDYWEGQDALKNIVTKINEYKFDVLLHGCKDYSCVSGKVTISRTGYDHDFISTETKDKVLKYLFKNGLFPGSAWITVTRREFIIENNIFFIKGIKAEDIDWLLNVFINANSYASTDDTFYVYLKYRNDSITGTADIKSIKDILYTISKWEKILELKHNNNIKKYAYSHLAYHYITTFIIYDNLPKENKDTGADLISEYKHILRYSNSSHLFFIKYLYNIIGLRGISRILSIYYKQKKEL